MKTQEKKPKSITTLNDFKVQLAKADAFFNDPNLPKTLELEDGEDPYADKDGLIEFIIASELIDNQEVMDKLLEQKKILISIGSIVTDYVFRYAKAYGMEYKTDAELWERAIANIPLMSFMTTQNQTYSRHSQGIEIAADFIELILDTVVDKGSNAMDKFRTFLSNQGESLRAGVETNADAYETFTFGCALEVVEIGDTIVYTPKIKTYGANFDRSNYKFSLFCASYNKVDINFDYLYSASIFDYEALEDPEVKEKFEEFIKGGRKASIERSKTFFEGELPPPPAPPIK
ncbi:hypothetical protein [uncultured Psychroserpens sp.]|uniref:hypothetical protein n=1 Tax=uncultured Psychroserpens sp. TaxID=255436 RepID=UPI0026184F8E|nr:hypothetical protein [uncultured Psychroserpens sp.]